MTGALLWQRKDLTAYGTAAELSGPLVYLTSSPGEDGAPSLIKVDAATGKTRWAKATHFGDGSDVALTNGLAYAGFPGGGVVIKRADSGTTVRVLPVPGYEDAVSQAPVVTNGFVLAIGRSTTKSPVLSAFRLP